MKNSTKKQQMLSEAAQAGESQESGRAERSAIPGGEWV